MNNKYYTPKIEEFHVGFEIEVYNQSTSSWYKKTCTIESIQEDIISVCGAAGMNWSLDGEDENHPSSRTRVKYLDKDDIEDCGFILTGKPNDSKYYFRDVDDMLSITVRVGFYKNGGNNLHLYEFIGDRIETLFSGEIKNKTELKTLLKKINGKNKTTGKSL